MNKLEITQEDWDAYDWHYAGDGIYIRGVKKTDPPDDGFVYVDVTTFSSPEQIWRRAQRYDG